MDISVFYNESSNAFYLLNPITIIIFISPNFILSKTKVCYQSCFREIFYYVLKKGHNVVSFCVLSFCYWISQEPKLAINLEVILYSN